MEDIGMRNNRPETENMEETEEVPLIYEFGELCPSIPRKQHVSTNRLTLPATGISIHIESMESNVEFKQSNRSADFIRGEEDPDERDQYIRQGQLLHNLFASIGQESDLPQAIAQLRREGILESEERVAQITKLAQWALKHPKVKSWYDGSWELFNECAILSTDEDGNLQTRRPDRVMMKNGQVVVVDFKFGKKQETYRKQVQTYMQLLEAMGYTHIQGYLWYVFANELEEVTL